MTQINLLKNYPITKRDLKVAAQQRTDHERSIARKFGKDFLMEKENMDMVDTIIIPNTGLKLLKILLVITN